jgi:homoserine dehydrogenase
MNPKPLIVLKFGGSVLPDESGLRRAVHEIYRWRRQGWRVAAVVSSLAGRTDELLKHCDRLQSPAGSPARAALVATGELESAALLHLHLERAGVPSFLISPGAGGIIAEGEPTDARPVALAGWQLPAILEKHDVVVIPGYVATTESGQTVVLGRGGSDLTALFLAAELGAVRCRLIKDVDGLYEADPAGQEPRPLRYATAHYQDALDTDGSIIQHKAVCFARDRGLEFELGAGNAVSVTRVGNLETRLEPAPVPAAPLRVGLLGHGTVGAGVAALLHDYPEVFSLAGVAVRNPKSHSTLSPENTWTDSVALARFGADIIVESMGGVETSRRALLAALKRGAHVVTANKTLLARDGQALETLASEKGCQLRASASVGAALPLLEAAARSADGAVRSVQGILCGTANFVLERLEFGDSLPAAIAEAQSRGLAEADPSRDLDGRDAADKLCVVAAVLGGPPLEPDHVQRDEIGRETLTPGARQVATLRRCGDGWEASVRLLTPQKDSFLIQARGEQNAAIIEREDGSHELLLGTGAGRWPTAEAVMADLLDIARQVRCQGSLSSENQRLAAH